MAFLAFLVVVSPLIIYGLTGSVGAMLIAFAVLAVIAFIYYKANGKKAEERAEEAKKQEELKNSLIRVWKPDKYSVDTLVITKRDPALAKFITIKDQYNVYIKYEPEVLHFGAATVGGVTTGGTYTTGGYNYIDGQKKNGLCTMIYDEKRIQKIELPSSLISSAKASSIAQYLNDRNQIVVEEPKQLNEFEQRMLLENMKTTGYVGNEIANKGLPTLEKAQAILQWLCDTE